MTTVSTNASTFKKRRWWIALLLQLISGSGYLYLGHPKRFLMFILLLWSGIIFTLTPLPTFIDSRIYLGIFLIVVISLFVIAFVDLLLLCRKQQSYTLKWYNRWWVYLLCWISIAIVQTPYLSSIGMDFLPSQKVRTFYIPSNNNQPLLIPGDYVFATSCGFNCIKPQQGDMVILKYTRNNKIDYVERIIGLPGDTVQIENGVVILNGAPVKQARLSEDHILTDSYGNKKYIAQYVEELPNGAQQTVLDLYPNSSLDNTPKYRVPEGHYFVMGDNRDNSADSRVLSQLGYVPAENIYAKPLFIYWSKDLSRIGTLINP
ncbi:Signal peptidase I [Pseudovibrio sp. Ad46]|uniref:signal peptidase I n=1 Tax=unclassified Pseudovibrio TaxID=2627060 RepID=UPI0007AEDF60|nr:MULTISPECIES: signal peptidase I [unclassified Pseudovibrio]KZK92215.1 Signal peptidase I [Pseudovibrio sp. Ad5]KZK94717.1 Signal peptidase I [Pseudovibrio sp. Ad46]